MKDFRVFFFESFDMYFRSMVLFLIVTFYASFLVTLIPLQVLSGVFGVKAGYVFFWIWTVIVLWGLGLSNYLVLHICHSFMCIVFMKKFSRTREEIVKAMVKFKLFRNKKIYSGSKLDFNKWFNNKNETYLK